MQTKKHCLFLLFFIFTIGGVLDAQMDPYFTAINHPVPQDTLMVMLLSDFQSGTNRVEHRLDVDVWRSCNRPPYGVDHEEKSMKNSNACDLRR